MIDHTTILIDNKFVWKVFSMIKAFYNQMIKYLKYQLLVCLIQNIIKRYNSRYQKYHKNLRNQH